MNTPSPRATPKRISDAADELGLKPHVLRYWETEFPQLRPIRTRSGQRLYDTSHMTLLRHIQDLLHIQGMTIEGAKRMLNALLSHAPIPEEPTDIEQSLRSTLQDIYAELLDMQALLSPLEIYTNDRDGL